MSRTFTERDLNPLPLPVGLQEPQKNPDSGGSDPPIPIALSGNGDIAHPLGIEPRPTGLESVVLPLHQGHLMLRFLRFTIQSGMGSPLAARGLEFSLPAPVTAPRSGRGAAHPLWAATNPRRRELRALPPKTPRQSPRVVSGVTLMPAHHRKTGKESVGGFEPQRPAVNAARRTR